MSAVVVDAVQQTSELESDKCKKKESLQCEERRQQTSTLSAGRPRGMSSLAGVRAFIVPWIC